MSGFVAQTLAIEYPERIRSLISMMATTGDVSLGQPDPETMKIFQLPPPTNRTQAMDNAIAALKVIGSPGFATDEADSREMAGLAYDRRYDPLGTARQAVASVASGDRTDRLRSVRLPALVIHGSADKMCDVNGGKATAAAIPGASLEIIEGMGHNMPRKLWPILVTLITDHILKVED